MIATACVGKGQDHRAYALSHLVKTAHETTKQFARLLTFAIPNMTPAPNAPLGLPDEPAAQTSGWPCSALLKNSWQDP